MMLQLADCQNCAENFLPAVDNETGRIYQINPETFLLMTPEEKRQFISELPEALTVVDGANGMGALIDIDKEKIKSFFTEATEKAKMINPLSKIKARPTAIRPQPAIMPTNGAPASQGSLFVGLEPSSKPWFARTEVLIGGAAVLLALGFGIRAATKR